MAHLDSLGTTAPVLGLPPLFIARWLSWNYHETLPARQAKPAGSAGPANGPCPALGLPNGRQSASHTQTPLPMTYPIQKTDAEWKALLAEKGAERGAFEV